MGSTGRTECITVVILREGGFTRKYKTLVVILYNEKLLPKYTLYNTHVSISLYTQIDTDWIIYGSLIREFSYEIKIFFIELGFRILEKKVLNN